MTLSATRAQCILSACALCWQTGDKQLSDCTSVLTAACVPVQVQTGDGAQCGGEVGQPVHPGPDQQPDPG